jgi:dTDP-glucose 4,6-dehydratase
MDLTGKKILVTGSDGFIGSHLVERLVELGCDVRAFVYYNSFNSCGWLDSIPKERLKKIEVMAGDIRDPQGVRKAVSGCHIVLHLAALIAIPFSYHSPDSYVDTNIKGTLNILNASRDLGVEKVIVTSTSEVYGTAKYVPIDEAHPLQGQSPYSATKIGADQLALSFQRSFETPVAIIRPFNTFGPRQSARAVIPTIITQIASGASELKLGSLSPTRDLTFVLDTVEGFVHIARSNDVIGRVVNLGSGFEISIGDLATKIAQLMNSNIHVRLDHARERPAASEVERLLADNRLARELMGWSPGYTLDQGLQMTIDWFMQRSNLEKYKSDIYNI